MSRSTPIARSLAMLTFFEMLTFWSQSASGVTLIKDGQAQCTIVVRHEDANALRAAEDLRYHLLKMSGAEVSVVYDALKVQGVGIYIGTKPLNVHVPGRGIDRKMIWPDGYVIEIIEFDGEHGVFLSSPQPKGVINAVYGLLEDHLGCHWFTIGPIGEHIPQRATVELNIPGGRDIANPSYEKRSPWYDMNVIGRDGEIVRWTPEEIFWLNQWYRRNRTGGLIGQGGHAWDPIFTREARDAVDEDGDGVSDLAIVFNGKRSDVGGLCLSHPKAVEIASAYFVQFLNANPNCDFASFFQPDSPPWCYCERCLAMASTQGGRMLILTNRIAENVAKVHPTKRILMSAYKETRDPPEDLIQGHPNVFVHIASLFKVDHIQAITADVAWNRAFRQQVEQWMKCLTVAWSYDYIGMSNGPWTLFEPLQQTLDFYNEQGYVGVTNEYLSRNVGTDVHMWLTLRTAWNSKLRVADLLDQFYPTYFGAADDDMRWIYEQIEQHMLSLDSETGGVLMNAPRIYPTWLLNACLARIATAKQKIIGEKNLLARIERDENGLKATRLWVRFCEALTEATTEDRQTATRACQHYVDFIRSLRGTMTLGGGTCILAERMLESLNSHGTYFAKSWQDLPWPGRFRYNDNFDQGGKSFHAKSRSGFNVGPYGLYLKAGGTGEIIYDIRLGEGLGFKEVYLPGNPGGHDLAIKLALPKGGHNSIEVSLDHGRTWIRAFQDLPFHRNVIKYDLLEYASGANQFLLKFWVHNPTDEQVLAVDSWTISGTAEPAKAP